jgi:hypothetical protein
MVEEISSCESWRDLLEILEDEAAPKGSGLTMFVGVKVCVLCVCMCVCACVYVCMCVYICVCVCMWERHAESWLC